MKTRYRLHDSTGHWIARVYSAMRREFDQKLREQGVTVGDWAVLASLSDGASSPSEIARHAGIDRAVAARVLSRLTEGKGYTSRQLRKEDHRSFEMKLTAAGKRLVAKLLEENRRINQKFLSGIGPGQAETLKRLLKLMLANSTDPRHHELPEDVAAAPSP